MTHHALVHWKLSISTIFTDYTKSYISSSSVKLKVVAATGVGVDGCFGDDAAKNMLACMPTSIVAGVAGFMLTSVGELIIKHGSISCKIQAIKLIIVHRKLNVILTTLYSNVSCGW